MKHPFFLLLLLLPYCLTTSGKREEKQGMTLQVFDMAFWAMKDPIQMHAQPVYSEVVPTAFFPEGRNSFWGEAPTYGKWASFFHELTQATCQTPPGNPDPIPDMVTSCLSGYFVPEADGEYTFTLKAESDKAALFLGQDSASWKEVTKIASLAASGGVGEKIKDNCYKATPIHLQKGHYYPLYAVCWFVHGLSYQIHVSGPGIEGNPIIPTHLLRPRFNPEDKQAKTRKIPLKKAQVEYTLTDSTYCTFDGLGLNLDVMSGRLFTDEAFRNRVLALKPGLLRWGALEANLYGFEKAFGPNAKMAPLSMGQVPASHARNMAFCNSIGAAYSICIGVKDGPGGFGGGDGKDYTVDYIREPETFLHLLEYLAGPANSPYGAKRAQEGFTEPLLTKNTGKHLILEMGNEVWGGKAHNGPIGKDYHAYGEWCRRIARLIETSPYWPDIKDKVTITYNGRNVRNQESYGLNESLLRGDKGELPAVAFSGYLGGNMDYDPQVDYGENVQSYYKQRTLQMIENLNDMRQKMAGPMPKKTYFYESQVSTPSYFGNVGQAVVLMDYLLSSLKYGAIYPSIFSMGGGEWRICLDDGTPLSHYELMKLIDTKCRGKLMKTTPDEEGNLVGINAFRTTDGYSILLSSRDFGTNTKVKLNLPANMRVKEAILTTLSSQEPTTKLGFRFTEKQMRFKSGDAVAVPAHTTVLLELKTR